MGSIRPGWLCPKEDHRPLGEGAFAPQLKYFTIEAEMPPRPGQLPGRWRLRRTSRLPFRSVRSPRKAAAEEEAALFCRKIGGGYRFCHPGSERAKPRPRPPVEIDYEKSLCPKPSEDPLLPQGRQHPRRGPASIRSRRTSRAGRPIGRGPRPAPPALPAPLPAGSVQGGVRPQQDPSTVPEVPADPSGGIEGGRALKRSEAALLPQGRQHPRRGPACIRSRRTSRAARPGRLPRRRRRRKAEPPSSSRPRHKCARSRSSAVGVGAILARRLIKG